MKIRKMTRYAVQIIGFIYSEAGMVTSNMISEAENIPHGVLMKVLHRLADNGILASHQGRGRVSGGFSLSKNLKNITLYDLMKIMGEEICYPMDDEDRVEAGTAESKGIIDELSRVNEIIVTEMQKYNLYDIVNRTEDKQAAV